MTPHIDTTLSRRKDEIRNLLIAGAVDKKATRDLLDELNEIYAYDAASAKATTAKSMRYAGYGQQIEAIVAYLEDEQEPRTLREIIDGVLAGGYRGGGKEQAAGLNFSLKIFLTGAGSKGKRAPLKIKGDRVGLKGWEDERWQS